MAAKSELKAKLSLDNKEFVSNLRAALGEAKDFSNQVASGMLKATGAMYVFRKVTSDVEGTWESLKKTFEYGSQLEQISRRTGIAVGALVELRKAALRSGVEFTDMEGIINKMQKSISGVNEMGKNTAGAFADIGLSINALRTMTPDKQFQAIGKAISELKNPVDRASAAMDIFGKSGGELLKIFENPNVILDFNKPITGVAKIMGEYAATMDQVNTNLKRTSAIAKSFWIGLAGPVSTVLLPMLKKINEMELSDYGLRLGKSMAEGVRVLYNSFQDGHLEQILEMSLEVGFQKGFNFLYNMLPDFAAALKDIFTSEVGPKLSNVFDGVALQFGAALLDALAAPITAMQGAISYAEDKGKIALDAKEYKAAQAGYQHWDAEMKKATGPDGRPMESIRAHWNDGKTFFKGDNSDYHAAEFFRNQARERVIELAPRLNEEQRMNQMTFREYVNDYQKNNAATFFGASSKAMRETGVAMANEGSLGTPQEFVALMRKIGGDFQNLKWKGVPYAMPATPLGDDSRALGALIAKYSAKAIPGEGKAQNPNEIPPGLDTLEDTGPVKKEKTYKLERMHRGLDGMTNVNGGRHHFSMTDIAQPGTLGGGVIGMGGVHRAPTMAEAAKAKEVRDSKDHTKLLQHIGKNTEDTANNIKMAIAG